MSDTRQHSMDEELDVKKANGVQASDVPIVEHGALTSLDPELERKVVWKLGKEYE